MKDGFVSVDDQCMSGVMTTLESHHGVGVLAEQVYDFSFTLITPLGSEYYDAVIHVGSMKKLQKESAGQHADDATDAYGFRIDL